MWPWTGNTHTLIDNSAYTKITHLIYNCMCQQRLTPLSDTSMKLKHCAKWKKKTRLSLHYEESQNTHPSAQSSTSVSTRGKLHWHGAEHWNKNHWMQTTHTTSCLHTIVTVSHALVFVFSRRHSMCWALVLMQFICQKMLTHVFGLFHVWQLHVWMMCALFENEWKKKRNSLGWGFFFCKICWVTGFQPSKWLEAHKRRVQTQTNTFLYSNV